MAHELNQSIDGTFEHVYRAEDGQPWHGLGTAFDDATPWDEVVRAAGLNHRIQRAFVRYAPARGAAPITTNEHVVLFREDRPERVLGVASATYKVVQPVETIEFFRDLIESQGYQLSTAGCLFGGARFWASAQVGSGTLPGGEEVRGYLLCASSADSSLSTTVKRVRTRVVCNNTLTAARNEGGDEVKVRHSSVFDADRVKAELGIEGAAFRAFLRNAEALANVRLDAEQAALIVSDVLVRAGVASQAAVGTSRAFRKVSDLYHGEAIGAGLDSAAGTAWGLLNAVTEYADHHQRARSEAHRFDSALFGRGDRVKTVAQDTLLALVA